MSVPHPLRPWALALLLAACAGEDTDPSGTGTSSGTGTGSTYVREETAPVDPERAVLIDRYEAAVAAVELMPGDAALYAAAGAGALRLDELELARDWLDQALAVDDRNLTAHQWMGVVLDRLGDPALAEQHLQIAADMSLEQPLPFLFLARVQGHLGNADAAHQNLERALGKDDVDSGVLLLAAEIAQELGNEALSRTYLIEVLTTNLECDERERSETALVEAYLELGDLDLRQDDLEAARVNWEAVLQLDPENERARTLLELHPL